MTSFLVMKKHLPIRTMPIGRFKYRKMYFTLQAIRDYISIFSAILRGISLTPDILKSAACTDGRSVPSVYQIEFPYAGLRTESALQESISHRAQQHNISLNKVII